MPTRYMAGLWLTIGLHGCAAPTNELKGEAPPRVVPGDGVAAAARRASVGDFEWRLRITTPTLKDSDTPLSESKGDIDLGFSRWTCRYTIESRHGSNGSRQEFGFVSCTLESTDQAVETMVLCMVSENRPSDCGTGVLRISDDVGRLHQLELSCRSASNNCAKRPTATERLADVGWPADAGGPAAGPSRPTPASGGPMGHFQWRVEIHDPHAGSSVMQVSSRHGNIEASLKGWRCSYRIAQQQGDPSYPELEFGYTTCSSNSSSDTVETVLVCAENSAWPSACNMGSLRLGNDRAGIYSITMGCKNPSNPCW